MQLKGMVKPPWGKNIYRRHLTTSQRAMVAANAIEFHVAAAKERQREAGRFDGKNEDGTPKLQVSANLREAESSTVVAFPGKAAASAAKSVGVSPSLHHVAAAKERQKEALITGNKTRHEQNDSPVSANLR